MSDVSVLSSDRIYEIRWGDGDAGSFFRIFERVLELFFGEAVDSRSVVSLGRYMGPDGSTWQPQIRCPLLEPSTTDFVANSRMTNRLRITPLAGADMYKISAYDTPTEFAEFDIKMVNAPDAVNDDRSVAFARLSMPEQGNLNFCNGDRFHTEADMTSFTKCLRCTGDTPTNPTTNYDSIFSIRDITPLTPVEWIQQNWFKVLIAVVIVIIVLLIIRKLFFKKYKRYSSFDR